MKVFFRKLVKSRGALIGIVILTLFIFGALFADLIVQHSPIEQNIEMRKAEPFTEGYILGTDDFGRDLFARIIYGARISLVIGIISVGLAILLGLPLGLLSGYTGGWFDRILMRLVDIMLAFPYVLLTIVIVAMLGPSLVNAMIAIGISQVPTYIRLARGSAIREKEQDYVLAEKAIGSNSLSIMFHEIFPNILAPIFVQATLGIGNAILSSAALSFLGLGAQPPTPEWGLMIASSKDFITNAWWIVTFPGLATLAAVLGFNLLGDGLRDILDPRMKD